MMTSLTSSPAGSKAMPGDSQTATSQQPWVTRRTMIRLLSVLLLMGALGGGTWMLMSESRARRSAAEVDQFTVEPRTFSIVLREKGELKAAKSTEIVSEVEGRTTIISLIPEGSAVQKGDLLVELASDQIQDRIRQEELKETNAVTAYEAAGTELEIQRDKNASDIRKANLKIELNKLALEKYEKGDWEQATKDADIRIKQAELTLRRASEDWEAAEKLYAHGYMTKTAHANDQFNFQKAGWDLEKAKKAKQVLETYTHVSDLRKRQSDLEEAIKEFDRVKKNAEAEEIKKVRAVEGKKKELDLLRDQLAKLRRQKEKSRITAPTQGFVVYYSGGGGHFMSSDNQIREGASVHERQIIMTLPDTSEMLVVVRIHEAKTDKLRLGQPVRIRVEGIPDKEFTGRVAKIAAVADSQNRWLNPDLKEYETEIALDPTDVPLKPGVTAHTEILVETVTDVLAVPVQAVYSKTGRRYVFKATDRTPEPVEIELGAIGTEWAEVTKGLNGGERILLAFGDEHKRLIPDLPVADRAGRPSRPGGRPGFQRMGKPRRGPAGGRRAARTPGPSGPRRSDAVRSGAGRRNLGRSKTSQRTYGATKHSSP